MVTNIRSSQVSEISSNRMCNHVAVTMLADISKLGSTCNAFLFSQTRTQPPRARTQLPSIRTKRRLLLLAVAVGASPLGPITPKPLVHMHPRRAHAPYPTARPPTPWPAHPLLHGTPCGNIRKAALSFLQCLSSALVAIALTVCLLQLKCTLHSSQVG